MARSEHQAFVKMNRRRVGLGLLKRINSPGLIDQYNTSMCGPAAVVFAVAKRNPVTYVRYVIDLFEKGEAMLGKIHVRPSSDCKQSRPRKRKSGGVIPDVDWIALASLRDNSNLFFSVETSTTESLFWSGVEQLTTASQIIEWYEQAGFELVADEASTLALFSANLDTLKKAQQEQEARNLVVFCIDPDILDGTSSTFQRHWIVVTGPIMITDIHDKVSFDCFTWGEGAHFVNVSLKAFLKDFYGFISLKF